MLALGLASANGCTTSTAPDAAEGGTPLPQPTETTAPGSDAGVAAPPGDAGAEPEAVARALCGGPIRVDGGRPTCSCPSFTETKGEGQWMTIAETFPGSFTGPGRDEVAVRTRGCETGAGSAFSFEGMALLRRATSRYELLSYDRGPFGDCTPVVSGSRSTRLVCHAFAGHAGLYRHSYAVVGWGEDGAAIGARSAEFLAFSTNVLDPEVNGAGFRGELRVLEPSELRVSGADRFAAGDEGALAVELEVTARVACAGQPPGCVASSRRHPLRFAFEGRKLVPDAPTRRALAELRAMDADR